MKQFTYLLTLIACSFALANCGRNGSLEIPVEAALVAPTAEETAANPESAKDETAVPPVAENDPEIVVDPVPENGLHTNPLPPDAGQLIDPVHPADSFDGVATPVGELEWERGQASL